MGSPSCNRGIVKVQPVLEKSQAHLIQLVLDDQLKMFEVMIDTVTSAIKQLHDIKLAIEYLSNDQMVKLCELINQTAIAKGTPYC
jgi:soluble P-type ATPase